MVPSSTYAPMLTNDGISTTFFAIYAPRRATAGGTTRTPAAASASSESPVNFDGTLS
jgi:hypothetical protein